MSLSPAFLTPPNLFSGCRRLRLHAADAVFESPPGLALAHDLQELLHLVAKRAVGLAGGPRLRHPLDVEPAVLAHLRCSSCSRSRSGGPLSAASSRPLKDEPSAAQTGSSRPPAMNGAPGTAPGAPNKGVGIQLWARRQALAGRSTAWRARVGGSTMGFGTPARARIATAGRRRAGGRS